MRFAGDLIPSKALPYDLRSSQLETIEVSHFFVVRGLNVNHNHDLKNIFKSAATQAGAASKDPLGEFYRNLLARGMQPPMARVTLARKIAAIVLKIWKKGERFDPAQLKQQAA
jgi:hypothetical protein